MKKKVKLVVNPDSGQRRVEEYLPKVMYIVGKNGYALDVDFVRTKDEIISSVRRAKEYADYVYVCGGDGSVNLAVNELVHTDIAIGIIPVGTTNVLALELNIPTNPFEAAYYLSSSAKVKKFDAGKIGDNYFGLMVSYGFDAHTISKVDFNLKKIIGRYAYVLAGFSSLFSYKPEPIYIDFLDGTPQRSGYFVVVGNAAYYGGKYTVTPLAKMDDGLLDVCIFKEKGILKSLSFAIDVLRGRHVNAVDVEYYQVPKLRLINKKAPGQVDGDLVDNNEEEYIDISVAPESVNFLV